MTSVLASLTAKKTMKMKFFSKKIYCISFQNVPNITNMHNPCMCTLKPLFDRYGADIFVLLPQMEENLLSRKALLEKAQSIAANAETRAETASKQVQYCSWCIRLSFHCCHF